MDKKKLTERDICTKFINSALTSAGWDIHRQVREEHHITNGRIIVHGRLHTRGHSRRTDYVLSYKNNITIAVIE